MGLLEIRNSGLFLKQLPQGIVASAFANRRLYLVLANYNRSGVEVETSDTYVPVAEPSAAPKKRLAWVAMGPASDHHAMDRSCFEKLSTAKQEAMTDERHETNAHVLLGSSAWTGVACW